MESESTVGQIGVDQAMTDACPSSKTRNITAKSGDLKLHKASAVLFLASIFLKQFYILPSGSFQLGDLAFMLAAASELIMAVGEVRVSHLDVPFLIFVGFETTVNCIWSFLALSSAFFIPIAHYLYILIVVLTARTDLDSRELLVVLVWVLRVALLIQIVVLFAGVGRWYMGDRYKGTFNDPNQFAFYLLSSFLTIKILCRKGVVKP